VKLGTIIFWACLALVATGCVGSRQEYVRTHNCQKIRHTDPWTSVTLYGEVERHEGFTSYSCSGIDDNVLVTDGDSK
jgi:hypothetical protein